MRYTMRTRSFSCAALLIFTLLLNGCGGGSSDTTATTTPVSSVTVYYGHSAAFKNTSTVMTWGYNGSGQLGNGITTTSTGPVNVLENGVKFRVPNGGLAIGAAHTLAFYNNSTVRAWGANFYGQLGNGSIANGVLNPVKVRNLTGVTAVAAGANHSLALKNDSTVWSWGNNLAGQLGNNSIFNSYSAVQVQDRGVGTPLTGVRAIAAGGSHSLALKTDDTVWAWGYNKYGQLGGDYGSVSTVPMQVASLSNVKFIAAGGLFSVAVKDDNTVWVWGYNGFGQLGKAPATEEYSALPQQIKNFNDVPLQGDVITGTIYTVSAGLNHILVLLQKNDSTWEIWGWGYNGSGQLGNDVKFENVTKLEEREKLISQQTPVKVISTYMGNMFDSAHTVDGLHSILAVGDHSLARTSDGLWAWGSNNYNQLGFETETFPFYLTAPKLVSGL